MEFIVAASIEDEGRAKRGDPAARRRADLVIRDEHLVAVVEFKVAGQEVVARTSITRQLASGDIDLVAVVLQPLSVDPSVALENMKRQWPFLRQAFQDSVGTLEIKTLLRSLSQNEITELASFHLTHHQLDCEGDRGVLPKTARMWRLLHQFGSIRPAPVIATLLDEKVATIHARINLSRAQELIPPVDDGQ